jgi:integrase
MPTHKTLTDTAVRRLKAKKGQQVDHFDQQYPGLAIRVSHSRKVWVYFTRFNGKLRRITFDLFPTMSVAAAHDAWRAARDAVLAGKDPAPPAAAAAPAAATNVGAVIDEWLRRDQSGNRTLEKTRRQMNGHVLPHWAQRDITSIGRRDILDLIDGVADRGTPIAARRLHSRLHRFFQWAVGRGIIQTNPMVALPKPGGNEKSRERVLTDAEIVKVWRAAQEVGYPYGTAVQLLALTGARREEISALRWDEIIDGTITLAGDRTKNGEPHIIPLSAPARALLDGLPKAETGDLVFPGPSGSIKSWPRYFEKLKKIAGIADWRLHDIRRTVATGLQKLGTALTVTESVLGHTAGSRGGIVGVYQKHNYQPEKTAALEAWGAHVMALVEGGIRGKVVAIGGRR